ncbi:MAG: toll/interleukin-1 receptor domain-containing protein [Piscinibacter sp.]|nr:toll/interleukin-1 receptor domain-containing protein [Piscinibacter sp.]
MAHEIFISYSSRHRDLTRQLAAAIEAQHGAGSVWWDHALEARGPYATQIRAALDAARVVVVIWSAGAQVSEYVYAEAVLAHAAHKLVNVRPADTLFAQIPEPFNIHHVEALDATDRILQAIDGLMAGRALQTVVPLHVLYERQHGQKLVDPKQSALPADVLDISRANCCRHATNRSATSTPPASARRCCAGRSSIHAAPRGGCCMAPAVSARRAC